MTNLKNYDKAYAEVIEVLRYIPLEDYEKIPKQYIKFMEENCDETCSFEYNIALPFEKQNISNQAKDILGMIFRLFIFSQEQKDKLNANDIKIKKQKEMEKEIKYNPDELFKNNNEKINSETNEITEPTKALIRQKESIILKIWNKIKKFFKKK